MWTTKFGFPYSHFVSLSCSGTAHSSAAGYKALLPPPSSGNSRKPATVLHTAAAHCKLTWQLCGSSLPKTGSIHGNYWRLLWQTLAKTLQPLAAICSLEPFQHIKIKVLQASQFRIRYCKTRIIKVQLVGNGYHLHSCGLTCYYPVHRIFQHQAFYRP